MRASPVPPAFSAGVWQGALVRGLGAVFGPRFCPPFSRYGRRLFASFAGAAGCFGLQSQKRGISNCPGKPEFRQRGQNSSRSDLRLLRSSDRPLRTAKFWPPGTVRNLRRFFLWFGQHPHLVREKDGRQPQPRTAGRASPTLMRLSCTSPGSRGEYAFLFLSYPLKLTV